MLTGDDLAVDDRGLIATGPGVAAGAANGRAEPTVPLN